MSSPGAQEEKKVQQPPAQPKPPPPIQQSSSQSTQQKRKSRRNFLKALLGLSALLTIIPYVPWGDYLTSSVSGSGGYRRQKVVIDNLSQYGAAAGREVNVNDLETFPPNSHWIITYPSSGDPTLDAQNIDTFVKYELIRLPSELGGSNKDASAFVAFSKVCVHLWCSPNYNPEQCTNPQENGYNSSPTCTKHQQYECPCHGSIYRLPDGKAILGPASLQPFPTNAIPMLTLSTDSSGILYIEPPIWDVEHNGILGYGRDYKSYYSFINPNAKLPQGEG
jgi:rieske iron-sulfur protein